jgi:hypothetical protein
MGASGSAEDGLSGGGRGDGNSGGRAVLDGDSPPGLSRARRLRTNLESERVRVRERGVGSIQRTREGEGATACSGGHLRRDSDGVELEHGMQRGVELLSTGKVSWGARGFW